MNGLHLTADLYDCLCDSRLLIDVEALAVPCRALTQSAGLTIVAEQWHHFPAIDHGPGGVTGVLLLAESHLAIHTWPEKNAVTLDVYVCNIAADNSSRAQTLLANLIAILLPGHSVLGQLQRGGDLGRPLCAAPKG
jgi:S-adenosylmethionine decarboxylase proenzyme